MFKSLSLASIVAGIRPVDRILLVRLDLARETGYGALVLPFRAYRYDARLLEVLGSK